MLDNENIDHRTRLKDLPSGELSRLIRRETEKETPDDTLVLAALHLLEEREPEDIPVTPREAAALKRYSSRVRRRQHRSFLYPKTAAKAASLLLAAGLLLGTFLPRQAQADRFWNKVTRWTGDFFAYFQSEEDEFSFKTYRFQTDNPGLQQVYDAVVEMGITDPVVPMWIPEGYELVECIKKSGPLKQYVYSRFLDGENECTLKINLFLQPETSHYFEDGERIDTLEKNGTAYDIFLNKGTYTIAWTRNNIECAFTIDCPEEILYDIIMSIYSWRSTNEAVY